MHKRMIARGLDGTELIIRDVKLPGTTKTKKTKKTAKPKAQKPQKISTDALASLIKDLSEIEKGKKPSGGFAEGFAAFTEGFVSATQGRAPRDLTASKDRARRAAASDALSQLLEQGRNKRADNRNNMTKENFKINSELRKQEVAISQERLVGTQKKTEIAQLKEVAKGEQLVDSLLAGANAGILSSTGKKEIAKALPHLSTQAVKAGIAEVEALPEGPERIAKAQEVTQRWLQTPGGTPASQPTSQRPTPEQARAEIERRRREREGR